MTDVLHAPHATTLQSGFATAPVHKWTPADSRTLVSGLRPLRGRWMMMAAVLAGVVAAVAIPIMIGAAVDGPVRHYDHRGVWVLGSAMVAFGVSEAAITCIRRRLTSLATAGADAGTRRDLHARLQFLPWSFHLRCQSGRLVSGRTAYGVTGRELVSLGALLLSLSTVQIAVVTVCLLVMYWPLGLLVLGSMVPIVATVLHGQGEFTRRKVPMTAQFWPVLDVIPNLALVVVLVHGAYVVAHGQVSMGVLTAFLLMTLSLVWPVTALGFLLSMIREAMDPTTIASGRRSSTA